MGKKSKRRGKQKTSTNRQNVQRPAVPQSINGMPAGYGKTYSTPSQQSVHMPFVTDALVTAIFERGGLPQHLNSFENVKSFLDDAFTGYAELAPFFLALAQGLEKGQPLINQPVQLAARLADKMPLLHWVCQHVFLNLRFGCHLSHDVVNLLLKAGADPNALRQDNQTTPLFFSMKYSDLETVDLLLEAGANVHQRDIFGQTCLKNAMEQAKPKIVRRLLEYLPAGKEMFYCTDYQTGEQFSASATDIMLGFVDTPGGAPPMSWVNLGVPDTDDFLETFFMIRQKGARLTQRGSRFPINAVSVSINFPDHPQIQHPELLQALGKVLIGAHIPENFRPKKEELPETGTISLEKDEEEQKCLICLGNVTKSITLYCGHTFCRECILEHGKNGADCPMCRIPLCRDISANGGGLAFNNVMGVGREAHERYGLKYFTNEQIEAEARAQGIYNNFSSSTSLRDKLTTAIENGTRTSREMRPIDFTPQGEDPSSNLVGRGRWKLELASNTSMISGTPPSSVNTCPKDGMVSIEVAINDIPLLARISNQSFYTVLCRSVVEQLGLKRIDKLKSRKFVDYQGKKLSKRSSTTFTCLEPLKVCFQGIEVTLRNAIEISPDPEDFMATVQLGQDFLSSGLLSVIDVEVGMSVVDPQTGEETGCFNRVVVEDSWLATNASRESFRYYSHDGKMADLPLIHFDPCQGGSTRRIMTISLREGVKFNQCHWCCRGFPDGMLVCARCDEAYYCDERCQQAAWKIHKLTCGVASR